MISIDRDDALFYFGGVIIGWICHWMWVYL